MRAILGRLLILLFFIVLPGLLFVSLSRAQEETIVFEHVSVVDTEIGQIRIKESVGVRGLLEELPEDVVFAASEEVAALVNKLKAQSPCFRLKWQEFPWEVHFIDSRKVEVPGDCVPATMTPPATIRIATDRLQGRCREKKKLPISMQAHFPVQVLVHEMAHPIEFVAGGKGYHQDAMLREGFATWFEQAAAGNADLFQFHRELAQESLSQDGESFQFSGSSRQYSRAAQYFQVLVERGGLGGLASFYQAMSDGLPLEQVLRKSSHLSRAEWDRQVNDYLSDKEK